MTIAYLNTAPKMSSAIISKKRFSQLQGREDQEWSRQPENESIPAHNAETRKTGKIGGTIVKSNFNMIKNSCNKYYALGYTEMMVLPFVPLTMTFKDLRYYVDTPPVSLTTVQI